MGINFAWHAAEARKDLRWCRRSLLSGGDQDEKCLLWLIISVFLCHWISKPARNLWTETEAMEGGVGICYPTTCDAINSVAFAKGFHSRKTRGRNYITALNWFIKVALLCSRLQSGIHRLLSSQMPYFSTNIKGQSLIGRRNAGW